MTSLARFGPVRTPRARPGATSATTSVIRFSVPCSTPLVRLITGVPDGRWGAASARTSRKPCEGTPMTTAVASTSASSSEAVAVSDSVSSKSGR